MTMARRRHVLHPETGEKRFKTREARLAGSIKDRRKTKSMVGQDSSPGRGGFRGGKGGPHGLLKTVLALLLVLARV
jgi:predicted Zn-dependent protease